MNSYSIGDTLRKSGGSGRVEFSSDKKYSKQFEEQSKKELIKILQEKNFFRHRLFESWRYLSNLGECNNENFSFDGGCELDQEESEEKLNENSSMELLRCYDFDIFKEDFSFGGGRELDEEESEEESKENLRMESLRCYEHDSVIYNKLKESSDLHPTYNG